MLVSNFNLLQSFNYMAYLFYKKRFKSEINSVCILTQFHFPEHIIGNQTFILDSHRPFLCSV
jgi:hypothetical protein